MIDDDSDDDDKVKTRAPKHDGSEFPISKELKIL